MDINELWNQAISIWILMSNLGMSLCVIYAEKTIRAAQFQVVSFSEAMFTVQSVPKLI